jgi:hypothetical protein
MAPPTMIGKAAGPEIFVELVAERAKSPEVRRGCQAHGGVQVSAQRENAARSDH